MNTEGPEATARPTIDEIRAWPVAVSVERSAAAYGISRAGAYEQIRKGIYPAQTIKLGDGARGRIVVLTTTILESLGVPAVPAPRPRKRISKIGGTAGRAATASNERLAS